MALKTKSIKAPKDEDDGLRISIMSRHTLSDGITQDESITYDSYDEWWPKLGPPLKLVGDYYKRGLPWDQFVERFTRYLLQKEINDLLVRLVSMAHIRDVTLLCVEDEPIKCHRQLVAQRCSELDNSLEVIIK